MSVYVVHNDLVARGLTPDDLVAGLTPVMTCELPALLDRYDLVWHW